MPFPAFRLRIPRLDKKQAGEEMAGKPVIRLVCHIITYKVV